MCKVYLKLVDNILQQGVVLMKTAIIGSRKLKTDVINEYVPDGTDEIVTGGASGIDACAEEYAKQNGIKLTVFQPNYKRYGRGAPIIRNMEIVEYADCVVAIWDGASRVTKNVIDECRKKGADVRVFLINKEE